MIGLGLIGQLACQLLRAGGCRVLGVDLDPARVKQALAQGAAWGAAPGDDHRAWRDQTTGGHGADFALVTAASESSAPVALAAELCRQKGRIASVGATGLDLDRRTFYEKELELRMSTSYGPGRYDRAYEEEGLDYPLAYVRWTENRNLAAFLALVAAGAVKPETLDTGIFPFEEAATVYEELAKGERRSLAAIFRYAETPARSREQRVAASAAGRARERRRGVRRRRQLREVRAAAGARGPLRSPARPARDRERTLGAPQRREVRLRALRNRSGRGLHGSRRRSGRDRHAARQPRRAREPGRCARARPSGWRSRWASPRTRSTTVLAAARETGGFLAVGYNRRFSPHARAVAAAFAARRAPLAIHYSVAAGPPPRGSWILDPAVGGGRIVGEVCHFIDLCSFLVGAPPASVFARALGRDPQVDDSVMAILGFPDGSTAALEYLASAAPDLPKERFEVSAEGRTARCENFKTTQVSGGRGLRTAEPGQGAGRGDRRGPGGRAPGPAVAVLARGAGGRLARLLRAARLARVGARRGDRAVTSAERSLARGRRRRQPFAMMLALLMLPLVRPVRASASAWRSGCAGRTSRCWRSR